MKLGLALGGPTFTPDNLRFAKQAGVTHIVLHLTDYSQGQNQLPEYARGAAGFTGTPSLWDEDFLSAMKKMVEAEGLVLEALENFNPAFWYDILLDGPRKREQMEDLKSIIRAVGRA